MATIYTEGEQENMSPALKSKGEACVRLAKLALQIGLADQKVRDIVNQVPGTFQVHFPEQAHKPAKVFFVPTQAGMAPVFVFACESIGFDAP
jgi:hypothetical protein